MIHTQFREDGHRDRCHLQRQQQAEAAEEKVTRDESAGRQLYLVAPPHQAAVVGAVEGEGEGVELLQLDPWGEEQGESEEGPQVR